MNWGDDRMKPTSRPILVAAIKDAMRSRDALESIIGSALPGSYQGPAWSRRVEWGARLCWEDHTLEIGLVPPDGSYLSFDADDLTQIKACLGADRIRIHNEGGITVSFDAPEEDGAGE